MYHWWDRGMLPPSLLVRCGPDGKYKLKVMMIGFQTIERDIIIDHKNKRTDFQLKTEVLESTTVTVSAERMRFEKKVDISRINITNRDIRRAPAFVDADLFIVDDGAGGTNRKTAASRLKTYIGGGGSYFLGGASGASGDTTNGLEDIFRVNSASVDNSCTIASSTNASAAGPLTVSSGVTVTVAGVLVVL